MAWSDIVNYLVLGARRTRNRSRISKVYRTVQTSKFTLIQLSRWQAPLFAMLRNNAASVAGRARVWMRCLKEVCAYWMAARQLSPLPTSSLNNRVYCLLGCPIIEWCSPSEASSPFTRKHFLASNSMSRLGSYHRLLAFPLSHTTLSLHFLWTSFLDPLLELPPFSFILRDSIFANQSIDFALLQYGTMRTERTALGKLICPLVPFAVQFSPWCT